MTVASDIDRSRQRVATCPTCLRRFSYPHAGKGRKRTYCSPACRLVPQLLHARAKWRSEKQSKPAKLPRKRKCYSGTCEVCGAAWLTSSNKPKRACGSVCARTLTAQTWERRLQVRPRYPNGGGYKMRARHHGVAYEVVKKEVVFERDGWRCQICGDRTPKKSKGTIDLKAPELDHRVPMAMGGPHTYRNAQLACRACNIAKGSRSVRGQMRLFDL